LYTLHFHPGGPQSHFDGKTARWQHKRRASRLSCPMLGRAAKHGAHANDTQHCYQKGGSAIAGQFVAV
jgi:hypothetical protein